ncbi:MAG: hypothetical protein HN348_30355 [Proteobacteria bacterium]|nr:hypothetical protein [Pseudomonadota bacterium]
MLGAFALPAPLALSQLSIHRVGASEIQGKDSRHSDNHLGRSKIGVVGIGCGGGNAVNQMVSSSMDHLEYLFLDRDLDSLRNSFAHDTILLDERLFCSFLAPMLANSDAVFIVAGMGGETGSRIAPLVAGFARQRGASTIGVVTRPFHFEGKYRRRLAEAGINRLRQATDQMLILDNQSIVARCSPQTTLKEAYQLVGKWMAHVVACSVDYVCSI